MKGKENSTSDKFCSKKGEPYTVFPPDDRENLQKQIDECDSTEDRDHHGAAGAFHGLEIVHDNGVETGEGKGEKI